MGIERNEAITAFYFSSSAAGMSSVTAACGKEMLYPSKTVYVVKNVLPLRGLCVFLRDCKDKCPNVGVSTLLFTVFHFSTISKYV